MTNQLSIKWCIHVKSPDFEEVSNLAKMKDGQYENLMTSAAVLQI